MSEKTPTSLPFAFPFGGEAMQKTMADAQARWSAALEDMARYQTQGMSHAKMMVDESAKIAHATLDYWTQLGAEWRKTTTEMAQRATGANTPR